MCILSSAQHRIKRNEGLSLFVNIIKLNEDSVTFSFLRQRDTFSISRSDVSYIEPYTLDPDLLETNFSLKVPYPLKGVHFDDYVRLYQEDRIKEYNLEQNLIRGLVYYHDSDFIKMLTSVEDSFRLLEIDLANVNNVKISFQSAAFHQKQNTYDNFIDKLTLDGEIELFVYIYEIGADGIKFSEKPLKSYQRNLEGSDMVEQNTRGLEYLSYNNIEKIELASGETFLPRYIGKEGNSKKSRGYYPTADVSFGLGYGRRLGGSVDLKNQFYEDGVLLSEEVASNLNNLYNVSRLNINFQFSQYLEISPYYSFSTTDKVRFTREELEDATWTTREKVAHQLFFHTLGIHGGLNINNFRLYGGPQFVLSQGYIDLIGIYQLYERHYSVTDIRQIRHSDVGRGWELGLSYGIDLGKVNITPSLSYKEFRSDLNRLKRKEYDKISYGRAYDLDRNPIVYKQKVNLAPLIYQNDFWSVISAGVQVQLTIY